MRSLLHLKSRLISGLTQVALFHQLALFVLFSGKKGGSGLCLHVDYHSLNANTVKGAWPLPYIDNLLSQIKGARVLSSLNLWDGYY